MGRWVFVRHGESTANAADLLAGHLDAPLTERGRAQATALAPRLAGFGFERALSSDLVRAFDTARLALGERGPRVQPVAALRERAMGAWEGASRRALREDGRFATVLLSWDVRAPGGESNREAALRALGWLEAVDTSPTTLLVAHGGVLRSLLGLLDGRAPRDFLTDEVPNAHPVSRELDPAAWRRARQRAIG